MTTLQQELPEKMDAQGEPGAPQVIPVVIVDNHSAAVFGFIMGRIGLIFSFIISLVGLICSTTGYTRSSLGISSSKSQLATAGKILSIIGFIFSTIIWLINVFFVLLF